MSDIYKTGVRCRVNGSGDLYCLAESRPFIDQPCIIVKRCKSGLIQVSLESDPKQQYSAPQRNIDIISPFGNDYFGRIIAAKRVHPPFESAIHIWDTYGAPKRV